MKVSATLFITSASIAIACLFSCKTGSINLFKADTPHEKYQRKLINAGLDKTALGSAWINAAALSLQKALNITIPYAETGYFAADKTPVVMYQFSATKGQQLTISLTKKPVNSVLVYLDIWHLSSGGSPKLLASADTLNNPISLAIDDTGNYLIRIQPELLQSLNYTLAITSGPSLAFPTNAKSNSSIRSYWGDGRDQNTRKHEGVDIFGAFRSPILAVADGTITRVNQNNLGGKVIWLRPKGKKYTLYYAHLDQQIATEGQEVKLGDTLGLMGNTGNAKNTPTHLHFGIYEYQSAINPLPFIDPVSKIPEAINASIANLNKMLRTSSSANLYGSPKNKAATLAVLNAGTIIQVNAATGNYYSAQLPDGQIGFIPSGELVQISKPLRKIKLNAAQKKVYDQPDSLAAVKLNLKAGQIVNQLGSFRNYQLISDENLQTGWIVK